MKLNVCNLSSYKQLPVCNLSSIMFHLYNWGCFKQLPRELHQLLLRTTGLGRSDRRGPGWSSWCGFMVVDELVSGYY